MKKFILVIALFCIYYNANAQNTLKGIVKDLQNNQPIPGAAITITATHEGTTTDDDGVFTLQTKNEKNNVTFKAIGYEKKEMTVSSTGTDLIVGL